MENSLNSIGRATSDGCRYMIQLLISKSGLSYNGDSATLASDVLKKGSEEGHAWVRLVAPCESINEYHGHTGEKGKDPMAPDGGKTYIEGIFNLQKNNPPKTLLLSPFADPLNPALFLQYVYDDGRDHGNEPGCSPNFEVTFCVSEDQFRRAQVYVASFEFKKYGGFNTGCGFFAAGVLDAAGLGTYQQDAKRTTILPDTASYPILWGGMTIKKTIRLATPGTPNYEKARKISYVYPDALADMIGSLPEQSLRFYRSRSNRPKY